ncbi:unnamed protein product [Amoebophrya sp. A25]|nr:unnamed protein product [Amoebophrya sp. A25]|eukprot:GSA25T00006812001.1
MVAMSGSSCVTCLEGVSQTAWKLLAGVLRTPFSTQVDEQEPPDDPNFDWGPNIIGASVPKLKGPNPDNASVRLSSSSTLLEEEVLKSVVGGADSNINAVNMLERRCLEYIYARRRKRRKVGNSQDEDDLVERNNFIYPDHGGKEEDQQAHQLPQDMAIVKNILFELPCSCTSSSTHNASSTFLEGDRDYEEEDATRSAPCWEWIDSYYLKWEIEEIEDYLIDLMKDNTEETQDALRTLLDRLQTLPKRDFQEGPTENDWYNVDDPVVIKQRGVRLLISDCLSLEQRITQYVLSPSESSSLSIERNGLERELYLKNVMTEWDATSQTQLLAWHRDLCDAVWSKITKRRFVVGDNDKNLAKFHELLFSRYVFFSTGRHTTLKDILASIVDEVQFLLPHMKGIDTQFREYLLELWVHLTGENFVEDNVEIRRSFFPGVAGCTYRKKATQRHAIAEELFGIAEFIRNFYSSSSIASTRTASATSNRSSISSIFNITEALPKTSTLVEKMKGCYDSLGDQPRVSALISTVDQKLSLAKQRGDSLEVRKKFFQQLVLKYHPDKNQEYPENVSKKVFQHLQNIKEIFLRPD